VVTETLIPRESARSSGRVPVVLIVDDYPDCREMYAAYLELAGFRVLRAPDGLRALQLAREQRPDLILMDLGLPGIDGVEVTRLLKADPATSRLPVVALTAQAAAGSEARLASLGFEAVIPKPCLPDELARRVESLVKRSRGG